MSLFKNKKSRGKAEALTPLEDPHTDMVDRAARAVEQTNTAARETDRHAAEAQRLLGAIRREVAVTQKARGPQK